MVVMLVMMMVRMMEMGRQHKGNICMHACIYE